MSDPATRPPGSEGEQWLDIVKENMRANGRKLNDAQDCAKFNSFRSKTIRKYIIKIRFH